jgi:hypothetical protein
MAAAMDAQARSRSLDLAVAANLLASGLQAPLSFSIHAGVAIDA